MTLSVLYPILYGGKGVTALERKIAEKEPMRRLGDRYLKWTAYGLLILLVTILQATRGLIPPVFGVRPLLVVPLTVCIAMFVGPVGGARSRNCLRHPLGSVRHPPAGIQRPASAGDRLYLRAAHHPAYA